jgi:protein-tyrosine-phosphatase
MKVTRVLFVCTGNTCRSPTAEILLRDQLKKKGVQNVEVFSRGIHAEVGEPLSGGAAQALEDAGIEPTLHHSARLSATDVKQADQIFVMTDGHLREVLAGFPEAKGKTWRLADHDIADPIGGSPSDYEKCRIEIQNALEGVLTREKHP